MAPVQVEDDALRFMAEAADGDARIALNSLEMAAEVAEPDDWGIRQVRLYGAG